MKYKFDGKYHFRFLVTYVNINSYKCRNLFIVSFVTNNRYR